jgi:hypothetical protein
MMVALPSRNAGKGLRFFSMLLLLVAYLPLRSMFSRLFVGVSIIQEFANLFIEIALVLLLVLLILQHKRTGHGLARTQLDFLFVLLGLSMFLSIAINNRLNVETMYKVLLLIRYVSVYYIVVNLPLSKRDIHRFMMSMITLGLGIAMFTIILYFFPRLNKGVENFFHPVNTLRLSLKIGAVRGMFPTEVELASFLLITLIVYLGYIRRAKGSINFLIVELFIPALFLLAIFATYKRALLLLAFFVLGQNWVSRNFPSHRQSLARFLTVIVFLLVFIAMLSLDIPANYDDFFIQAGRLENARTVQADPRLLFTQLLSPVYWSHVTTWQRGWVILNVPPFILTSRYWLFGLSPDQVFMQTTILQQNADLNYLSNLVQIGAFEDVYWVALLVYYGLAGLLLFFLILYKLFRIAQKAASLASDRLTQAIAHIFGTYIIVFIYSGFVYRVPEFRPSSFLFWLLAGLTMRSYLQILSDQRRQNNS